MDDTRQGRRLRDGEDRSIRLLATATEWTTAPRSKTSHATMEQTATGEEKSHHGWLGRLQRRLEAY